MCARVSSLLLVFQVPNCSVGIVYLGVVLGGSKRRPADQAGGHLGHKILACFVALNGTAQPHAKSSDQAARGDAPICVYRNVEHTLGLVVHMCRVRNNLRWVDREELD